MRCRAAAAIFISFKWLQIDVVIDVSEIWAHAMRPYHAASVSPRVIDHAPGRGYPLLNRDVSPT
jgi:hypothetical protein